MILTSDQNQTNVVIRFKKLTKSARLPSYAHPDDAGMDVYSCESYRLKPSERKVFSTGIASQFPSGYVALVWDKSSLGVKGIHALCGVIDPGYRGEWFITLLNTSDQEYTIERGDKIAQVLIQKIVYAKISQTNRVSLSARGKGKMGSTGKR